MLSNIPEPQPDQTMESLAALAAIGNGLSGPEAAWRLFGAKNQRSIRNPFHDGVQTLFRELAGAGFNSSQDLLDQHGFVRLFKPFVPGELYAHACRKLLEDKPNGIAYVLGTTGSSPFSPGWRYCQKCMRDQIDTLGYAYPRRSDQVLAKMTCSVHSTPLVTIRSVPEQIKLKWGLVVSPDVKSLRDGWTFDPSPIDGKEAPPTTIGIWVDAAVSGELQCTRSAVRRHLILNRLASRLSLPQGHKALPGKLVNLVHRQYSSAYLKHVGLPIAEERAVEWPAMLASGSAFVDHPIANLLVLAMLFESPSEFNKQANEVLVPAVHSESTLRVPMRGFPSVTWRLGLLKDILRLPSLDDVAAKHGLNTATLLERLTSYPNIRRRRRLYLKNQTKRRHRATLSFALSNNPDLRRAKFMNDYKTAYNWLVKNDRIWLLDMLPLDGLRATKNREELLRAQQHDQDQRVAKLVTEAAQVLWGSRVPMRVTRGRIIEVLSVTDARNLSCGLHPEAQRALDSLVETSREYEARVLVRLEELINESDAAATKQWTAQLLQQFSYRTDVVTKVVDKLFAVCALPSGKEAMAIEA